MRTDLSAPLLLQQLLRAMEDPLASRSVAVGFAVLTLAVRIVATQSAVINLWYSRRCYERSRGEMITMIYEKTLARKIIGASKELEDGASSATIDSKLNADTKQRSSLHPLSMWNPLQRAMLRLFRSNPAAKVRKEPASMGKILNMMRCASHPICPIHVEMLKLFSNDVYEVSQR